MTTMKKLTLGLSAVALATGGVACAQAPANPPRMERPRMDADGDGTVTRAEAQTAAAAMFARMDANKDGKLDKADRELARQQMRDARFARMDANGDGSISKTEFSAERGPKGGEGAERPGNDGPRAEGRKDGKRGGHHRFGKGGHGRHGGMMMMAKQADTNNDGAISQAEFTAAAMKRFDAEDANKDGKVTKEERTAARQAMKAKWQQMRADKKADSKAAN
ncbi:hypothetical protein GR702_00660 [Novosphingobium sp. FGD1]|uniref:EF-hand domain-containing protein n=1 Tax=Novosphingobium silvae TaxID=2692619 RepID=A0A7X4GEX3_9SPHN|nr:hypothetical protein [Novosphingobium silvae]